MTQGYATGHAGVRYLRQSQSGRQRVLRAVRIAAGCWLPVVWSVHDSWATVLPVVWHRLDRNACVST
jgi:hypothetical protein